jgi:2-polyprenyl-3-methyl-5-hydroxy-6-metoxy-1,4-benzoquinol methylase
MMFKNRYGFSTQKTKADYMFSQSIKPCNICSSTEVKKICNLTNFAIVCCKNCGLVYADEHLKEKDLRSFYTGDYYDQSYIYCQNDIDTRIAIDYLHEFYWIDKLIPVGGRVLDFGCARGSFIKVLMESELGSRWEGEGIDINPYEIELGQSKKLPVHLINPLIRDKPPESYDAVTCFSVLEHTQNPKHTLKNLARVLKSKGKLLIIVPNYDSLILRLGRLISSPYHSRLQKFTEMIFHKGHLYYFSQRTLCRILKDAGFQTLKTYFRPSYLESYPYGPFIALGSTLLRNFSRILHRQTMLVAIADKL